MIKTKRLIIRSLELNDYKQWLSYYTNMDKKKNWWDLEPKDPNDLTKLKFKEALKSQKKLRDAPKNIYVETSSLIMWPLVVGEKIVNVWREFGTDRVLLGSDWPVFHPQGHIHLLENYPLSDDEREKIIKRNGRKLFSKYID